MLKEIKKLVQTYQWDSSNEDKEAEEIVQGILSLLMLDPIVEELKNKSRHSLISEILSKLEGEKLNVKVDNYDSVSEGVKAQLHMISFNQALEKAISIIRNYEGKE